MKKFMKWIDIYGTIYNFTIHEKSKHNTVIGGISTIITGALIILCFISLGKDLFLRINPKYFYQKYSAKNYPIINLSNDELFFAVRMEDVNGSFVNHSDYFNITLNSYQGSGPITLPVKNCSELNNTKKRFEGFNNKVLEGLICFDLTNVSIGGYWDINLTYYLNIKLTPKSNYNDSFMILDKYLDGLYFRFLSSYYYTDLEDFINPLKIDVKDLYILVDKTIGKVINYQLMQGIIKTDYSILLSNPTNYSLLGFEQCWADSYVIGNYPKNIQYLSFEIYLTKHIEIFQLTYMKIQDVFASLGGIINFLMIFIGIFTEYLSATEKYLSLINEVFDFSSFKDENNIHNLLLEKDKIKHEKNEINKNLRRNALPLNNFENSEINKNLRKTPIHVNNIENTEFKQLNVPVLEVDKYLSQFILVGNENIRNIPIKELEFQKSNDLTIDRVAGLNSVKIVTINDDIPLQKVIQNLENHNQTKYYFKLSWINRIRIFCCQRSLREKELFFSKVFIKAKKLINNKLDIIQYLNFCNEYVYMKNILFDEIHALCLNNVEKPKFYEKTRFNQIYSNNILSVLRIVKHYQTLSTLKMRDKQLYVILSPEIKKMITTT